MRILFDARVLGPANRHGIARHAEGLLKELVRDAGGHRYLVLHPEGPVKNLVAGHPAFELKQSPLKPYTPAELIGLPAVVGRSGADLYYSPTYLPPAVGRTPLAFTIHDLIHLDFPSAYPLSRRLAWRLVIVPQARRAEAVLTGSGWVAGRIARRLKVPPERIEVIGHGLEAAFKPRPPQEVEAVRRRLGLDESYIVIMGNPKPHKNLAGGVAAGQTLFEAGFKGRAVIVGAGNHDFPTISRPLVKASGLTDDDLAALYSGAVGAIFPSLAEGFGLPPLEALACRCPVTAFGLPVLREVLGDEAVFWAEPGNGADLARAAGEMIEARETAETKAAAGARRAAGYTWSRAADRLRRVFGRIEAGIGRSGQKPGTTRG